VEFACDQDLTQAGGIVLFTKSLRQPSMVVDGAGCGGMRVSLDGRAAAKVHQLGSMSAMGIYQQ